VSRNEELASEFVTMRYATIERLRAGITSIGAMSDRCIIKPAGDAGLVYVAGPPRFLALVKGIVQSIDKVQQERNAVELAVKVFPLRYAWAEDQTVIFRETEVTIPGVATMLSNLVGAQGGPTGTTRGPSRGTQVRRLPASLDGLRGNGLSAVGRA